MLPNLKNDTTGRPPSCVVCFLGASNVILSTRCLKNTYFKTRNIDSALLRKIYIKEILRPEKFLFQNSRSIARTLGFKYIWHNGDKFFVRQSGRGKKEAIQAASPSVLKQPQRSLAYSTWNQAQATPTAVLDFRPIALLQ